MVSEINPIAKPKIPEKSGGLLQSHKINGLVKSIFIAIPEFIQRHENQLEYNDLVQELLAMAEQQLPLLKSALALAETELQHFSPEAAAVYAPILKHLREEAQRMTKPVTRQSRPTPPTPESGGHFLSASRVDLWQKVGRRGTVNGGLFYSGDVGSGTGLYSAYHHDIFQTQNPLFTSQLSASAGIFSLIPDFSLSERYIVGVIPALRLFLGSEQDIGLGFSLREGIEGEIVVPVGIHLSPNLIAPIDAGIAVGRPLGNSHLSAGLYFQWQTYPQDVQDPTSVALNHDMSGVVFRAETPIVTTRLALERASNETRARLELSRGFSLGNGRLSTALSGSLGLSGDWSSVNHGVFLTFGYQLSNATTSYGVTAEVNFDLREVPGEAESLTYARKEDQLGFDVQKVSTASKNGTPEAQFACRFYENYHDTSNLYICDKVKGSLKNSENLWCKAENNGLTCSVPQGQGSHDPGFNLQVHLEHDPSYSLGDGPRSSSVDGTHEFYQLTQSEIRATDPLLMTITEQETLNSFVAALKSMDRHQQMHALNALAQMGYATYDARGLSFLSAGKINTITNDDMYTAMRSYLLDPEKPERTTVCRGIAKLVAHTAAELGFEAKTVSLQGSKILHVVTALREPGETWQFINYGNGTEYSGHRDMIQAIGDFAAGNGYPPQLRYVIFDHNGRYERTLLTNDGRLLLESTTPSNHLNDFLEFNR